MVMIQRVTSAEIFKWIKPNLQTTDEWNAEQLVDFFTQLLQRNPELINISAAFEQEECVAFMISLATTPGPMVFIAQAWAAPGLPDEITSQGFAWLVAWTKSIGRKYLKIETFRGAAMARKWGFTPYSEILKFDIPEGLIPSSLIKKEEVEDGRRNTTAYEHTDVRSGERSEPTSSEDSERDHTLQHQSISGEQSSSIAASSRDAGADSGI